MLRTTPGGRAIFFAAKWPTRLYNEMEVIQAFRSDPTTQPSREQIADSLRLLKSKRPATAGSTNKPKAPVSVDDCCAAGNKKPQLQWSGGGGGVRRRPTMRPSRE